jgi:hypothetical protein
MPWYSQWQNTYGTSAGIGVGLGGYSNSVLQTNGTGTTQWAFADSGAYSRPSTMMAGTLKLEGDDADVIINGVRLSDTLNKICERLNLVTANEKLEQDWADLAELGRQYREKEAWVMERVKLLDLLEKD